jgi:hypothetical protein
VKVLPAAVMVAVLAEPELAATRYVTDPFPEPEAPDVIVSQLLVTLAVHAHPAPAVTRIVPVESSAPTLSLVGEMANEHAAGGGGVGAGAGGGAGAGAGAGAGVGPGAGSGIGVAAACWTVTVCGPTVTVPARPVVSAFRATCSATVPARFVPALGAVVIHVAALDTDQAHPVRVSTVTVTSPPSAETVAFAGETL